MKKGIFLVLGSVLITAGIFISHFRSEATKSDKNNVVSIAMATDDNYVYPTVVAMTSILENKNKDTEIDFRIMVPGNLEESNTNKFLGLKDKYEGCSIDIVNMKNMYQDVKSGRYGAPSFYRLSMSSAFPDLKKIIWLDGDTLTFTDLNDMFNLDMENYYFKGFLDHSEGRNFAENNDHYICSGVMLVNLEKIRNDNIESKFDDFIEKNGDKLDYPDQAVINAVCCDNIGHLPAKYGIFGGFADAKEAGEYRKFLRSNERYSTSELEEAYYNPSVLHVVKKPWQRLIKDSDTWWSYAEKTDCFKEIQAEYLLSDGVYKILSGIDENKLLSADKSKKGLQLSKVSNNNSQEFTFDWCGDMSFTIKSKDTNLMLSVDNTKGNEFSNIELRNQDDTDSQKWYLEKERDGSYHIISKQNGLYMEIDKDIQCKEKNSKPSQNFKLVK